MPHSNRIKAQHTHPLAISSWTAVSSTEGGHVIKFWLIVHIVFVMASIQWYILGHLKIVFPPLCLFIILCCKLLVVFFRYRGDFVHMRFECGFIVLASECLECLQHRCQGARGEA